MNSYGIALLCLRLLNLQFKRNQRSNGNDYKLINIDLSIWNKSKVSSLYGLEKWMTKLSSERILFR